MGRLLRERGTAVMTSRAGRETGTITAGMALPTQAALQGQVMGRAGTVGVAMTALGAGQVDQVGVGSTAALVVRCTVRRQEHEERSLPAPQLL